MEEAYPVLLYDGVCAFCNGTVQFVIKHDRKGTMRFAPLQGNFGRSVLAKNPDWQGVDSVILLEGPQQGYLRSTAALRLASYLGGIWKLFLITYIVPRPVRDFFYNLFAKQRYRIFGKYDECMRPLPELRRRFIES